VKQYTNLVLLVSQFLNPPLQELLGPSLSIIIIIIIIIIIKNTMRMFVDEPPKIIPYFMWLKVW